MPVDSSSTLSRRTGAAEQDPLLSKFEHGLKMSQVVDCRSAILRPIPRRAMSTSFSWTAAACCRFRVHSLLWTTTCNLNIANTRPADPPAPTGVKPVGARLHNERAETARSAPDSEQGLTHSDDNNPELEPSRIQSLIGYPRPFKFEVLRPFTRTPTTTISESVTSK